MGLKAVSTSFSMFIHKPKTTAEEAFIEILIIRTGQSCKVNGWAVKLWVHVLYVSMCYTDDFGEKTEDSNTAPQCFVEFGDSFYLSRKYIPGI